MTPTFRLHSLLHCRLSLYALAGGSLAAFCPTLSAAPIRYDTVYNFSLSASDGKTEEIQFLDLNGDKKSDFQIRLRYQYPWYSGVAYSAAISGIDGASEVAFSWDYWEYPQPFGHKESIGPDSGSWNYSGAELAILGDEPTLGGLFGLWPNDITETRYEGVRFQIAGQTHYGWIAASANVTDTAVALRISGWAYETTPNTAIQTGEDEVLTPEPSSLSLFALGAAGIAAVMRRRRSRA